MSSKLCEDCNLYDIKNYVGPAKEGGRRQTDPSRPRWPLIRTFQEFINCDGKVPVEAYCVVKPQNSFILKDAGTQRGGKDYLELRVTAWRDHPLKVADRENNKYVELLIRRLDTSGSREQILHSRPVSAQVDIALIQSWLQLCLETHRPMENHHFSIRGDSYVPQVTKFSIEPLVIDVHNKCITKLPESDRYSTLSYVWGPPSVSQLKLLRENSEDLQKLHSLDRKWDQVPTTIKDAISLCADLGVPYLWVDAMCIPQDDKAVMAEAIADMGYIYSNSVFNIVAASGKDSWAGLPGLYGKIRKISQFAEEIDDITLVNALPDFEAALENSIWQKRGWCLQEGLLAAILIIFTDSQVFFHCNHSLLTEDLIAEVPLSKEILYITGQNSLSLSEENILRELHKPSLQCGRAFHRIAGDLNSRAMTVDSDRLKAFEGISRYLAKRYKLHFWEGMPVEELDAYLLFDVTLSRGMRSGFSSWTWAGWTPGAPFAIPDHVEPAKFIKEIVWHRCKYEGKTWILQEAKSDRIKTVENEQAENLLKLLEDVSPSTKIIVEEPEPSKIALPFSKLCLRGWTSVEDSRIRQSIADCIAGHKSNGSIDFCINERRAISRIIQAWMTDVSDDGISLVTGIQVTRPTISVESWALATLRQQWKGFNVKPLMHCLEDLGLSHDELERLLVFQSSCASIRIVPVNPRPPYVRRGLDVYEALVPPWTIQRGSINIGAKPGTTRVALNGTTYTKKESRNITFIVVARRITDKRDQQTASSKSTLELMAIETDQRGISRRVGVGLISMNDTSWSHFQPKWKTVYLL